ncbi:MAG: hypothetical protein AB9900_10830 [Humidesulfovibrio sp.]
MRDPLLIVIIGNVRRAGPGGCTVKWLEKRVNAGDMAIEKALALQVMAGIMTEENGVYKMVEVLP